MCMVKECPECENDVPYCSPVCETCGFDFAKAHEDQLWDDILTAISVKVKRDIPDASAFEIYELFRKKLGE